MWEVLLYMQPGCQTTRGMRLLEQLVQARVEARYAQPDVAALTAGKALVQTDTEEETWIMCKAEAKEGGCRPAWPAWSPNRLACLVAMRQSLRGWPAAERPAPCCP